MYMYGKHRVDSAFLYCEVRSFITQNCRFSRPARAAYFAFAFPAFLLCIAPSVYQWVKSIRRKLRLCNQKRKSITHFHRVMRPLFICQCYKTSKASHTDFADGRSEKTERNQKNDQPIARAASELAISLKNGYESSP